MVVKFHLKMDNDSILTYHVHNSNIKIGAVKKRAIKKTATTLKRVGKQSFLWYNKFDEKIPTRI